MFAVSPAGSAARALFDEVGGGTCVHPDEPMAEPLSAFVAAAPRVTRHSHQAALERYAVGRLTAELALLLDTLSGPR